ncbi:hypothetical protein ACHHYP_17278 [Achlya hypogyna]|uniref:Uncharacterized protein n=1 Tax=Achlya hypogyna TaxID=1202772 RepID=A0A1V9Y4U7_ACHHY|nr:hypothetical protein ACHHYP_17278 [Achlya hypogyna]
MTSVLPTVNLLGPLAPPASASISPSFSRRQLVEVVVGYGYVLLSLLSGMWFLHQINPSFSNDLFWANYNLSGYEAYLIDVSNAALATTDAGEVDFMVMVMDKTYISPVAATLIYPTYARSLALTQFTSIEYAVPNLRNMTTSAVKNPDAQLCWVDFAKQFEVAHTEARQARCEARYHSNAAVFYEAYLRNTNVPAFLKKFGGPGNEFTVAMLVAIEASAYGRSWLASVTNALPTTSILDEIDYWRANKMTQFVFCWQNGWIPGITETMIIRNALGFDETYTTKSVAGVSGPWTSANCYFLLGNDWWVMQMLNQSLIRGADNYFGNFEPFEDFGGFYNDANQTGYVDQAALVHNLLGPFLSVDALLVAVPAALRTFYAAVQNYITSGLAMSSGYRTLPALSLQPHPPAWDGRYEYFGGNILCPYGGAQSFVQESFSTDDACTIVKPLTVATTKASLVFAMVALAAQDGGPPNISAICALQDSPMCSSALLAVHNLLAATPSKNTDLPTLMTSMTTAVMSLNVSIMQFATLIANTSDWHLLQHPILSDAHWRFYGLVYLCDWVEGKREVVAFEGDAATLVHMSAAYVPVTYSTGVGTRYLSNANDILFYLVNYMSVVLLSVGSVCAVYGVFARTRIAARNLLYFNRLVGSVWVGRPLLVLRGFAAIVLLSTSPIVLETSTQQQTSFEYVHRSAFDALVLTGEACWVSYVVADICLLFSPATPPRLAQGATYGLWLSFFVLETMRPMALAVSIDRTCSATNMDFALKCESGTVVIGDLTRVIWLFLSQVVVVIAAFIAGGCRAVKGDGGHHLLVSSSANCFMHAADVWALDSVSCVLCGLLPFRFRRRAYLFDIKLWLVVAEGGSADTNRVVPVSAPLMPDVAPAASSWFHWHHENNPVFSVLGLVYIIFAIVGSVSYFEVSQVNLANDLSWATFSMTGAHAFIANYLNEQALYATFPSEEFRLDDSDVVLPGNFNDSTAFVSSAPFHASIVQFTLLNTTTAAIQGLRVMDPCLTPWIFTAYCFVDFERRWSVAHSAERDRRCQAMTTNGAVYLEALLRNVKWSDWTACGFADSFALAVGAELQTTAAGQLWLAAAHSDVFTPVAAEEQHWAAAGITSYTVQWQNYKTLGLINTYSVKNAYGEMYPFTLQSGNGSFDIADQTTFKMYWGWANDLEAVAANATTGIASMSLVRSSANYAFANYTITSVLMQTGVLTSPLSAGLSLVAAEVGPFGTIDTMYVAPPASLRTAVRQAKAFLIKTRAQSLRCHSMFSNISTIDSNLVAPAAWLDIGFYSAGGSILCDDGSPQPITSGLRHLLSRGPCPTGNTLSSIGMSATYLSLAALLSNLPSILTHMSPAAICAQDTTSADKCTVYLHDTIAFFNECLAPGYDALTAAVAHARTDVQVLQISLAQMGVANLSSTSLSLYSHVLLDPADPRFNYFAWFFLYEWTRGGREVVSFVGDVATLTLMTTYTSAVSRSPALWELSTIVASYARACVQYVTFVMIFVALMAALYIVMSRGHVEGLNMLVLNRVGGIVWIGRPLLFVRSLTAVCLLSTGTLTLGYKDGYSAFASTSNPWYKTWLAASEVTWLLSVVNDVLMVVTLEYTPYCATPNSLLVWLISAVLSATYPVEHTAELSRDQCYAAAIDFQVICSTATIGIGSTARLLTLILLVVACNVVVYVVVRITLRETPTSDIDSLFLYAGARYLFWHSKWKYHDVYYLDKASAVLNGILPLRWRGRLFALDIKLWRVFVMDVPDKSPVPPGHEFFLASQSAMPLVE